MWNWRFRREVWQWKASRKATMRTFARRCNEEVKPIVQAGTSMYCILSTSYEGKRLLIRDFRPTLFFYNKISVQLKSSVLYLSSLSRGTFCFNLTYNTWTYDFFSSHCNARVLLLVYICMHGCMYVCMYIHTTWSKINHLETVKGLAVIMLCYAIMLLCAPAEVSRRYKCRQTTVPDNGII